MSAKRTKKPKAKNLYMGLWHIYEMELWDEDFYNMGWLRLTDRDEIEGLICFHMGDRSEFKAIRASPIDWHSVSTAIPQTQR